MDYTWIINLFVDPVVVGSIIIVISGILIKIFYYKGQPSFELDSAILTAETKIVEEVKEHSSNKQFESKVKEAANEIIEKDVNVIETIHEVPAVVEIKTSDVPADIYETTKKRGRPAKAINLVEQTITDSATEQVIL